MIRFLHAADLHLGLRITRFEEAACQRVGEARFTSLQQLRAKGAELKVDFIVIAGDVFDDHSISKTDASRVIAHTRNWAQRELPRLSDSGQSRSVGSWRRLGSRSVAARTASPASSLSTNAGTGDDSKLAGHSLPLSTQAATLDG